MSIEQLLAYCFAACTVVCWLNVYRIVKDKEVSGVSVIPTGVFLVTTIVEIFYFSARFEWWNAAGAFGMFSGNLTWIILYIIYQKDKKNVSNP